jgi:hypothetical protein
MLVVISILLIIVLGLVSYVRFYNVTTTSKLSTITSEEHVNKTTSNLTESLRNISETLNEIENILGR